MSQGGTDKFDRSSDEALGWVARLRSDRCNESDHQAFALWLAESPLNRRAMDDAQDLWDDLGALRHLPLDEAQRPAANQSRWWAAAAVAASLALAAVLWPLLGSDPEQVLELRTAMGEQLRSELEDGSRLILNTDSRVVVRYDESERQLELLRGEAFFEVAKDPQRPFHVDTGSARVTAIGTAFNVRMDPGQTSVTVAEGVVRVTERGATGNRAPATEVLHANQALTASSAGLRSATAANVAPRLAWQRGELVANGMRIPDLVAELQRYSDIHVLLGDADIATMTVSGVYRTDQPLAALEAASVALDLELVKLNASTVQLLKTAR